MENASKALIMAAGVLIAILIVSLILYGWGKLSEYQKYKNSLANVEDITKFNESFTNFDREDVNGYELISLANKVADYNTRYSNLDDAKSDEKYNPIKLTINLISDDKIKNNFTRDDTIRLFRPNIFSGQQRKLIQDAVNNKIKNILNDEIGNIEGKFGGANAASQITKNIDTLFFGSIPTGSNQAAMQEAAIKKFNSLAKDKISTYDELLSNQPDIYKYYEYMQFKKAEFKCEGIQYDNNTGRVSNIEFEFVKI